MTVINKKKNKRRATDHKVMYVNEFCENCLFYTIQYSEVTPKLEKIRFQKCVKCGVVLVGKEEDQKFIEFETLEDRNEGRISMGMLPIEVSDFKLPTSQIMGVFWKRSK